jgi:hypothetical protein
MTGGVDTEKKGPEFVELKDKEVSYAATIYNGAGTTDVIDLSFSGDTKLGEIKNEKQDFFMELNFAELKEIRIDKPLFASDKYKGEDFIKASVSQIDDTTINNVLIPRNTLICGKKGIGLTWYLRDIKKIVIHHEPKKTVKNIVEKQGKGWWKRLKDFLNI